MGSRTTERNALSSLVSSPSAVASIPSRYRPASGNLAEPLISDPLTSSALEVLQSETMNVRPLPLHYLGYEESELVPNIVVDGSPNASTVLTLTHWPGYRQPDAVADDLSAQMAYHHLDHPVQPAQPGTEPATVVTNNHYDQDGLVGVHALVGQPGLGSDRTALRPVLIDVAAAGDFGTYHYREAARASMALSVYAEPDRSPLGAQLASLNYPDQCQLLYLETLPLLVPLVTEPERFRRLWEEEDAQLTASEKAIASGAVTIEEHPDVDLAVVTIPSHDPSRPGHRFAGRRVEEIHPMAINNVSACFRQLIVHGTHVRYLDRYETWVQYRSRRPLPRVDLRPLAEHLSGLEPGSTRWEAEPPGALTPALAPTEGTDLSPAAVTAEVIDYLRRARPAWDPYRLEQGSG
jgi:hypothetical protein